MGERVRVRGKYSAMKPPLTPALSPQRGEGVIVAVGLDLSGLWENICG
jgi:hypothetical protein